jgi:transposase InsO family protein
MAAESVSRSRSIHGLSGQRVARILDRIAAARPLPKQIVVDNGPEFTSRVFDAWAYQNRVELHFIRPGKPVDNAFIEFQRQVPRRVPPPALVSRSRRCAHED